MSTSILKVSRQMGKWDFKRSKLWREQTDNGKLLHINSAEHYIQPRFICINDTLDHAQWSRSLRMPSEFGTRFGVKLNPDLLAEQSPCIMIRIIPRDTLLDCQSTCLWVVEAYNDVAGGSPAAAVAAVMNASNVIIWRVYHWRYGYWSCSPECVLTEDKVGQHWR